jgi:hypothetical protein
MLIKDVGSAAWPWFNGVLSLFPHQTSAGAKLQLKRSYVIQLRFAGTCTIVLARCRRAGGR